MPLIIFIILISLSGLVSSFIYNDYRKSSAEAFDAEVISEAKNITAISDQLISEYATILRGARGLFDTNGDVTRVEWDSYARSLNLRQNYPSVTGLIYFRRLQAKDRDAYIKSVRNDTSLDSNGYPDFGIFPQTDNEELFVAHFGAQGSGTVPLGFDINSEISRRKALEMARDSNTITISSPLTLLTEDQRQRSVLIILPVYKIGTEIMTEQGRQENIAGYVVLAVQSGNFINQILSHSSTINIQSIKIDDNTNEVINFLPKTPVSHDNGAFLDEFSQIEKVVDLAAGNRFWQFTFLANQPGLATTERMPPLLIFILGAIISILIASTIYSSQLLQLRAEKMAQQLTLDLNKFKLAVETISEQIVISDPDANVLYANPISEKITGYKVEEMIGKKAGSLWGGLMPKEFYQEMWQTIKINKKTFLGEIKNRRKNGEEYYAAMMISPVLGDNDEVLFFVAVERDITQEKLINEVKTQFISLASHQLRTPLAALRWNLEMMMRGDMGQMPIEQQNTTRAIYQSVLRMISLVNNLLNVSKIESGKMVVEIEPTSLPELVEDILKQYREEIKRKSLVLKVEIGANLPEVAVDKKLISEVYNNLISNSVKYTNKGGITIKIFRSGDFVTTQIIDTGMGIPQKDQARIFEKFHRGSNVVLTETEGTGLGLYLVKTIINILGGKIWFESAEGSGSTFAFSMPIQGVQSRAGSVELTQSNVEAELKQSS